MASEHVDIALPIRGINTNSPHGQQPEGTTAFARNVRATDLKNYSRQRLSQRPGQEKVSVEGTMAGSVRAVGYATIRSSIGEITPDGAAVVSDSFTRSDTAAGDDDIDGGTTDWTIVNGEVILFHNSSYTVPSGKLGLTETRVHAIRFGDGTKAGGVTSFADTAQDGRADDFGSGEDGDTNGATLVGPRILTNRVEDGTRLSLSANQAAANALVSTPHSSANATFYKSHLCIYTGATATPTGAVVAEISVRTSASATTLTQPGAVGLAVAVDSSKLTTADSGTGLPQWDGCALVGIGVFNFNSGTIRRVLVANSNCNETSYDLSGATYTEEWDSFSLVNNTTYTLRLARNGGQLEFYIKTGSGDFILMWYCTDFTARSDGTPTPVSPTGTKVGFWMSGVDSAGGFNQPFSYLDDFAVYNAETVARTSRFVAESAGSVYFGGEDEPWEVAAGGSVVIDTDSRYVSMEIGYGETGSAPSAHFADGVTLKYLDIRTGVVMDWQAETGSIPGSSESMPRAISRFRDRATLYLWDQYPNVIYQSRRFDWFDWNYTPTDPDGEEAVNFQIGDPVTCCGQYTEDIMLIGTDQSVLALVGDYALGGTIDLVTDKTGIVGPFAFALDDQGNGYFWGYDGLYRIPKGSRLIEPMSLGRIDEFADRIDHDTEIVRLAWSTDQGGLLILVEPATPSASTRCMFWDQSTNAFFEDTYPALLVPRSVGSYRDGLRGSRVMYGGGDGHVRWFDPSASTDDGTIIESRIDLGPFMASQYERAILRGLDFRFGNSTDECKISVVSAAHARDLTDATARLSQTFAAGRTKQTMRFHVGGDAVGLRIIGTGGHWSIEGMRAMIENGGRVYAQ